MALLTVLGSRTSKLEAEIRKQAKPDKRVEAVMAIPGTGLLSAMTLVPEVGDISRFPTARELSAWAGLTPSMRNSGRAVHHGHMTKAGPRPVRHVLGEAAQAARRYEPYAPGFAATKCRRGTGVALVRVPRELLVEVSHVLPLSKPERQSCERGRPNRASP